MSSNRRGPSAFLLLLVGIAALATGWTAMNYRGGVSDKEDLSNRDKATATVVGCEQDGPVSVSGVGYWWNCDVDITTKDGETTRQSLPGSRFEPADKGKKFEMVAGGFGASSWVRTDVPANNLATTITAAGLLVGVGCLVVGLHRLVKRR
ncbi:DUF6346 domain-containing protein [Stackebrandtia nassauensis]|uniref:Uncharacterized protein n=1 Tax=Stackebrandtia nassauensis (strain DSM 44728 / CIP 108903 / NRRL B-16338 / NBRC 102104 / LLR-40K-21) TaxID=446470 RepID=D3PVX1_STANL|nr:DUF6346 domain-containing protein [Stackebrandtia nassauensis]ADD45092.1 hypothetical protein Snas_5460 [Stackebrandtia nassauensis DSM 44728]